ncbi:uncharacterized protein LOC142665797 [Rhinoderma darwinii]|uniref:uncharacterized protein LOC142665797 n=1 Tax=Rhinoderma darwinii TaxID=43563 RepID=UPI003F66431D
MGTLVSRIQGLCGRMRLKKATVVMIGLDGSGKTTILYRLKLNEAIKPVPTVSYNVETLDIFEDISLVMWDVSLGAKGGPLKRHYLDLCQGFLFVVDSKDTERFGEAREDLRYAIYMVTRDLPFIVLANKQDLDGACSPTELEHHLKLDRIPARKWDVCGCSGVTGEGLQEALEKLCKMIKEDEE